MTDPVPAIRSGEAQIKALIAFAGAVLDGYVSGVVGDIDGGWLQEKALELGLLVASGTDEDANYYLVPWLTAGSVLPCPESLEVQETQEDTRMDTMGEGHASRTASGPTMPPALVQAANRMKALTVPVPPSEAEKMPDPDFEDVCPTCQQTYGAGQKWLDAPENWC